MDKFGRLVLPKAIRAGLGLVAGDRLEAVEEAGAIILRPVREPEPLVDKGGVLGHDGTATGDLEAAVRAHREGRIARASGWPAAR